MGGHEQQWDPLVGVLGWCPVSRGHRRPCRQGGAEQGCCTTLLGAPSVHEPAPRHGGQPAGGIARNSLGGPLVDCLGERFGQGVLGQIGASGVADQPAQQVGPGVGLHPAENVLRAHS